LREALGIWWIVHNSPGPETDPCHHECVCQLVIDYSKKYGLESCTEHFKPYGLDKFQSFEEVAERKSFLGYHHDRLVYVYPNPKDENGRFIPMIRDKRNGETIGWPKHPDGRFLTTDELEEQGI
jgi:hypothetical protein